MVDLCDVQHRHLVNCIARSARIVRQAEQVTHLIERKAQVARALDERQAIKVRLIVKAVIAPLRRGAAIKPSPS